MAKLWPSAPCFTGIKLRVTLLKIVTRLIRTILVASFSMNGNRKWNLITQIHIILSSASSFSVALKLDVLETQNKKGKKRLGKSLC